MKLLSKRTKVFGLLTVGFFVLTEYLLWRAGCGPHWLRVVHAAQDSPGNFQFDPCGAWQRMPLSQMIAAFGLLGSGTAFLGSFARDIAVWLRTRKAGAARDQRE